MSDLKTRNPELHAVAMEAATMAYRAVLKAYGTDGTVQLEGPGEVIDQQEGTDRVTHVGFISKPAAGTEEIVIPCEAGPCAIGDRVDPPSFFDSATDGDAAIYDGQDAHVWCNNGDVRCYPKSGSQVYLGGGGTTRDVAYANATEANASATTPNAAEAAKQVALAADLAAIAADLLDVQSTSTTDLQNIKADLANIKLDLNTLFGFHTGAPVLGPLFTGPTSSSPTFSAATWSPTSVGTAHGYVKTGSGTTEVLP